MFVCLKLRLCTYLLEKGFMYEKTEPNRNNPKFTVWLFKISPELRKAVNEYYAELDAYLAGKETQING